MNASRIVRVYLLVFAISIVIIIFLSLINDCLFIDPIRDEQFREEFQAGKIPLPPYDSDRKIIDFEVEWPLHSLLFYYGLLSVFWFAMGAMIKRKYKEYPYKYIGSIPILTSIVTTDYLVILHVTMCILGSYMGGKSSEGAFRIS